MLKTKKLLIKEVRRTIGGLSSYLGIEYTDGSSDWIPGRVTRATFHDATLAVLKENGETISLFKVKSFGKDNKPIDYKHLWGKQLRLDGSEEIVDCRKN